MSQVLDFTNIARPTQIRLRVVPRGDEADDIWPQASHSSSAEEDVLVVDPANTPKRVLTEVFALFATVAMLVLTVTLFVPGPSS